MPLIDGLKGAGVKEFVFLVGAAPSAHYLF